MLDREIRLNYAQMVGVEVNGEVVPAIVLRDSYPWSDLFYINQKKQLTDVPVQLAFLQLEDELYEQYNENCEREFRKIIWQD